MEEATDGSVSEAVKDVVGSTGIGELGSLEQMLLGNSLYDWLIAAVIFVVALAVLNVLQRLVVQKLKVYAKKTKTDVDDAVIGVVGSVGAVFYTAVALFMAVQHLSLPSVVNTLIRAFFFLAIVAEVIKMVERVVVFLIEAKLKKTSSQQEERKLSSMFRVLIRVVLWSAGLLLVLSNLGFNVNSLIAGLGIGGLAISLALQNILGDLFSSFSIAMDKPFEEGDFIICGEHMGTVKHIGLKTTRLTALQGEEIVISNAELTTTRIQNFKKLQRRRVVFSFGLVYGTPPEKLKEADAIVQRVIEAEEQAEFDRCHFYEFGDSSLNFEVVYYVTTGDYNEYMNTRQDIHLGMVEEFEKAGLEFAFPTRTVYMAKAES